MMKLKNDIKMRKISSLIKSLILVIFTIIFTIKVNAQQDPQYTQYMYNTMSINSGYAGQRQVLSVSALYRAQWIGINGAPKTISFGIHSPLRNERVGIGLGVVSDQIGPTNETYFDANFSYTIPTNASGKTALSFGIKGGFHVLVTDWSIGRFKRQINQQSDPLFNENLNLFSPTVGAGLYLRSENWYLGLSIPNFITTNHYGGFQESSAAERLHYFLIGGYVFDLNENTKLKPAFLIKAVSGAPLIADLSINALFNNKFTLGLAYRWDDSISGMAGFQVSEGTFIGYAYDYATTKLNKYNSGTHEIILRFELQKIGRILSPRFF